MHPEDLSGGDGTCWVVRVHEDHHPRRAGLPQLVFQPVQVGVQAVGVTPPEYDVRCAACHLSRSQRTGVSLLCHEVNATGGLSVLTLTLALPSLNVPHLGELT